jgi:hypothetical protein
MPLFTIMSIEIQNFTTIKGLFKDFSLSDVLIGLQRSLKTGILETKCSSIQRNIYLKNGDIIFAASNQKDDRLGEVLLKAGKITLPQYYESVKMIKETKKKQGAILVELGYLKPNELIWAIKRQVHDIILNIFSCEYGRFDFKEGPLGEDHTIKLNLSAANIIYRGIKKIISFNFLIQDIPPMDAVLCLTHAPLDLFQDLTLDETDKKILSYIDGRASVQDIFLQSPLKNDFETLKTLYALLNVGIIKVREVGEESQVISPEEVITGTQQKDEEILIAKIEGMFEKCKVSKYYEILGVSESATPGEIKKAFYSMAKQFHPDKHFSVQLQGVKDKLNKIFHYINQAYATLSNPESRKEYDKTHSSDSISEYSNVELAEKKFDEGLAAMRAHNFSEAESLFSQAIYLNSSEPHYHYQHACALQKLKQTKKAVTSLNKALKHDSQNPDYIGELGYLYLKLGFRLRAHNTFVRALKVAPLHKKAMEGMKNSESY